jgi:hypothetical protein
MKKYDWRVVTELTGISAIVASLVFVGLQMKQSQEIAIAEQYQTRAIAAGEYMEWLADNDALHSVLVSQIKGVYESGEAGKAFNELYETQGPDYLATKNFMDLNTLISFDNYYFQYQQGFMEEESWVAFRYRLKKFLGVELSRSVYTDEPQRWREPFQRLCAELIAELEHEAGPAQ